MSPFAIYLKQLRLRRGYKQKALAHQLGYESSYLSALERGDKGLPRQDFIRRLIRGLNLNEAEQAELAKAIQVSRRQISLPAKASVDEYRLLHALEPKLGQLHPVQIQLIEFVLRLPQPFCVEEGKHWGQLEYLQPRRMEAPKM